VFDEWDTVIAVYGNPPSRAPKNIKELIERLYESHPRSPFDHRRPPLSDWRQQLDDFESGLLNSFGKVSERRSSR
jgi:hypothetical protein